LNYIRVNAFLRLDMCRLNTRQYADAGQPAWRQEMHVMYGVLTDIVVVLHVVFVVYAVAGGALVLWRPRSAWLHAPTALWAAGIELGGWICPLTPLENWLRERATLARYGGGFIERYIMPVIYPDGLTRRHQIALAALVIIINAAVYIIAVRRWRRRHRSSGPYAS